MSLVLPRRQWGHDDLLYVGNDYGSDCLTRVAGAAPLFPGATDLGGLAGATQTMGVDYFFDGEDILLLTSDFVVPPHLWRLRGDVVSQLDERLEFTELFGHRVSWGVALEDFDGDGHRDALIAHARLVYNQGELPSGIQSFMDSIHLGGVMLLKGDTDAEGPRFVDQSQTLLPVLEGGFHAVVVADLFGDDGLGDGCPDVLLSPMSKMAIDDSTPSEFLADAELLLCNHPRRFTGVRMPRSQGASAPVAELVLVDGTRRLEPVRTSHALTGSRDALARFDLGPLEMPDHIAITLDDGSTLVVDAPTVGRYAIVPPL